MRRVGITTDEFAKLAGAKDELGCSGLVEQSAFRDYESRAEKGAASKPSISLPVTDRAAKAKIHDADC